jgi:putative ABC transport system permease protein
MFNVVGVVNNFHFKDLHSEIESYGFVLSSSQSYNYIIAHASTKDLKATLASISQLWNKLNPNEPFDYTFLDQDFQKNYAAEERLAGIIKVFTILAIFISCLGLFGLTTFSAEQRTKEIGVRKVLGANVPGIIALLSKDFLKLVSLSVIIACPIAWFAMDKWLQSFAYRTDVSLSLFVVTASIVFAIAIITISFQAVKAAIANPVKSLRME